MNECQVAVVGAGPYGLAAAAHLRRAGLDVHIFGEPMSFWRQMPAGMLLRSNWSATNIAELRGDLSLDTYKAESGAEFDQPVPLGRFIEYGDWVQRRVAPDVDLRRVRLIEHDGSSFRLELTDGDSLAAERVVVACGIAPFAWRPPQVADLPSQWVSHTGDHSDLGIFRGRRVAVVGGGQSALESAALLNEAGAVVEALVRRKRVVWLRGNSVKKRLGSIGPVVYAPTDVGPLWYSRLVARPDLFTRLPRPTQDRIARRSIRPAGAHWLVPRLRDVAIDMERTVARAQPRAGCLELTLDDGTVREVDHLLLGTGYRVDIGRYPFLPPELLARIERVGGYPVLSAGLESSVPGLHFLGAPAAWSIGPIMRFVSGTWYGGRALAARITRGAPTRTRGHRPVLGDAAAATPEHVS